MKVEQKKYTLNHGWETTRNDNVNASECNLVMAFGSKELLQSANLYQELKESYPNANILMNTTAGEIIDVQVNDETISLTAVKFEKTQMEIASTVIGKHENSFEAGYSLAKRFNKEGLKNLLVIADGQMVNGSELIKGLQADFEEGVIITGGLAGDGTKFSSTLVGLNSTPAEGIIAAIGFYGPLTVSYGSIGGWDAFGPERLITKSEKNVLFELDGKPALEVYKKYLGDQAADLPASGLLYQLSIRTPDTDSFLVRTILNINEEDNSLIFAGNMPEGNYARLMIANLDRLIEGSSDAAQQSLPDETPQLALLISCVGRKLVLDQRIEEEVEVVRTVYGNKTAIAGFYSYGEFSPSLGFAECQLHNQTMTITTYREN